MFQHQVAILGESQIQRRSSTNISMLPEDGALSSKYVGFLKPENGASMPKPVGSKTSVHFVIVGQDSEFVIVALYGMKVPGTGTKLGQDIPQPSRPALVPTEPPAKWLEGLILGGEAAGSWR
jgi:hypothetical protein